MSKHIKLDDIVTAYATIMENALLELRPGTPHSMFELDMSSLLRFLEGYHGNVKFVLRRFDFRLGYDTDPIYQALAANEDDPTTETGPSPISSFTTINRTEEGGYLSNIFVDDSNNHCWTRFAILKEVCHTLLIIEHDDEKIEYTFSSQQEEIFFLAKEINTLPFSINDFEVEGYSPILTVENAAEVLAFLILCNVENLRRDHDSYESLSQEDKILFDYFPTADAYKVPKRYVELFLTNDLAGELLDRIEQSMGSTTPFDTAPPPPPKK